MSNVMVIHDTRLDEILKVLRPTFSPDVCLKAGATFDEGFQYLAEGPLDVVVIDQQIPQDRSNMAQARTALGDLLVRVASEAAATRRHPCLALQYTVNPESSVCEGRPECPIYRFGGDYGNLGRAIAQWLTTGALSGVSARLCVRGILPWEKIDVDWCAGHVTVQRQEFLDFIHWWRHTALSPYTAINTDLQLLPDVLALSTPGGVDTQGLLSQAESAISRNAAAVPSKPTVAQLLALSPPSPENVKADEEVPPERLAACQTVEGRLRQSCAGISRLAGQVSDTLTSTAGGSSEGAMSTIEAFQRDLREFSERLEAVVQFFEIRYRRAVRARG